MTKTFKFTVFVITLILIIGAVSLFAHRAKQNLPNQAGPPANQINPANDNQSAKTFTHPSLGYSFEYPAGFTVGQFQDGAGDTVLVQPDSSNKSNLADSSTVQIYVQSFDEPGPITSARIKQDLPDQEIQNPQNLNVGGEVALIFNSPEPDVGQAAEAWFVHQGQLYRLTAPVSASAMLNSLLASWKFDQ